MSRRQRRAERAADSLRENAETAGHRHARLHHILLEELDALFRDEISDPSLEAVMITAIELSLDCRNVRAYFAHPQPEDAERALARALPFIRARLAGRLSIKRAPEVRFVHDPRDVARDAARDVAVDVADEGG